MDENRKFIYNKYKPYIQFFVNYLVNLYSVHAKVRQFRPLITNFYLTKKCNLKCRYCYPPGLEPDLETAKVLFLLDKIRPYNPAINFTGGEPLLYPGIQSLLQRAKTLRFYPIILSTNGLFMHKVINAIPYLDHLVISLDSLNTEVNDLISGVKGTTKRIIHNIENCARLSRQYPFHFSIHTVIAPETIEGIEQIVAWCERLRITFSVSPEHGRYYPNSGLRGNKEYTRLIDRLIELKRRGKPIACSYNYLRVIQDFSSHACYPFVSPRVEPDGRVYFPCQRIKKRHVYLQDYPNLCLLMQKESEWIADSNCRHRCFLACYLEVERYIKNPFSIFKEIPIKRWILGQKELESS